MDMLRFQRFSVGKAWITDYGSSDDPAEFKVLLGYSPLHNIKAGADYPATLVTTSDHDDRVVPAHSFKYAATLQAKAGAGAPKLIRIETNSGHGASKPDQESRRSGRHLHLRVGQHGYRAHLQQMKAETAMRWLRQAGIVLALASSFATAWAATPPSEDDTVTQMRALPWQRGPATSTIGDKATVKLPEHAAYLNAGGAGKFLTLTGNLPSPNTSILSGGSWWAALDFNPIGYVKDDEKIDADDLLKSIKASDTAENEERRKQGLPELHTDGWYVPPHYDSESKHLEWGVKLHSSDNPKPIINYSVRLLGRTGVESVVLVSSPEKLDANVPRVEDHFEELRFQ